MSVNQEVVASCAIHDRVSSFRCDVKSQVESGKLCKAVENVLELISELKVATIVQDVTDCNQESQELRGLYDTEVKYAHTALFMLSENITPMLESLEAHYYHSCASWGFDGDDRDTVDDDIAERDDVGTMAE